MPVIPEDQRLTGLREIGVSEAVIRLSAGEVIHELFGFRCRTPPFFVYHGANPPDGPMFAPLWDCCDIATGVWEREGQLEFLEFSIEEADEYRVLAHTEQGLLASLFVSLYEDRDDLELDDFREPARLVGFRHLEEVVAAYDRNSQASLPEHESFRRRLIEQIDRREKRSAGE
jgi:hypothetical protein